MDKIRVCSWDVGIINLAYCIIEKNMIDNTYNIIDWGIIDLTNNNKKICNNKQKNGSVCGKKASLYSLPPGPIDSENNTPVYYCNTHSKSYKPLPDNWQDNFILSNNKKQLCEFNITCKKIAKFSYNNKFYCKNHCDSIKKNIIKSSQLIKIKKINARDVDLQILAENICTKIDLINGIYNIDQVLIEHQPVLTNPNIKTIGCFIFHHFVVRCKGTNKTIRFISASNKLKIENDKLDNIINGLNNDDKIILLINKTIKDYLNIKTDDTIQNIIGGISKDNYNNAIKSIINHIIDKNENKKNQNFDNNNIKIEKDKYIGLLNYIKVKIGYNINKLLSVKYSNVLLPNNWLEFLNNNPKKDDLCDAYLQGYQYLKNINKN